MAVEIHVLSGARQGQQISIDAPQFRVGDEPACLVAFDSSQDPSRRRAPVPIDR